MTNLLIRGLDKGTVDRLRVRAKRHGRSLEAEARLLLEQAAGTDREEAAAILARWKERFANRTFSDSADQIREHRQR